MFSDLSVQCMLCCNLYMWIICQILVSCLVNYLLCLLLCMLFFCACF
jgi:hypothetical protein